MPDEYAGLRPRCPECATEAWRITDDLGDPIATSGKAMASLAVGACVFLAVLGGVPAILLGRGALKEIDQSKGMLRGRWMAIAGIVLGAFGCLATIPLFMAALGESREASRRYQCVNNLKQIGLALHNYHQANGCFPAAAIVDAEGRPLLSWRVAILPYFQADPRLADFHLDEPWDSPHNFALLKFMPGTYACPSDETLKPGTTGYRAVLGGAFTSDFEPLQIKDFTDGTSNTLFIGESLQAVPWTKPDDLAVGGGLPLHGLGSRHNNGFNALFVDGSVHFLKSTIDPNLLDALITRNGGEVISSDAY
jgi:prepilin-type processing-associated H-X9-DG protein